MQPIPVRKEVNLEGEFIYHAPKENVNFGPIKASKDVDIRVMGGDLQNVKSENGSVTLIMSNVLKTGDISAEKNVTNHAIDPSTPKHILDFLSKRTNSSASETQSTALTNRVSKENEQKTADSLVGSIIGSITRCAQCGIRVTQMLAKQKIGPSINTPNGVIFEDLAHRTHEINANGVYHIINEGEGRYRVERVKDHDHFR